MACNSASPPGPPVSRAGRAGRLAVFALWGAVLAGSQASFGGTGALGDPARRLEEGIEMQIRGAPSTVQDPPQHQDDADAIDPWELVGV